MSLCLFLCLFVCVCVCICALCLWLGAETIGLWSLVNDQTPNEPLGGRFQANLIKSHWVGIFNCNGNSGNILRGNISTRLIYVIFRIANTATISTNTKRYRLCRTIENTTKCTASLCQHDHRLGHNLPNLHWRWGSGSCIVDSWDDLRASTSREREREKDAHIACTNMT